MLKFRFEEKRFDTHILQPLQTFQIFLRYSIQQNIKIIHSWKDKSSDQIMTGVNINVRSNSVDVPYKPGDGYAQIGWRDQIYTSDCRKQPQGCK